MNNLQSQILNKSFKGLMLMSLLIMTSRTKAALAGTYTINPGSAASAANYQSLTSAISDMVSGTRGDGGTPNGSGVSGPVILELDASYTDGGETYPLTLGAVGGASSTNTITVRPAPGTGTARTLTGSATTVSIDNGDYYIIDGRPGGSGSNKYIEITSSTTTSPTVSFLNDATNNIIRYCTITGANTTTTSGVVLVGSTSGSTGNDNNTIDYCTLDNSTAGTPVHIIYAVGNSSMPNNSGTISNCNISDYYLDAGISAGIRIADYNQGWTISGNSIFQTATRTSTASTTSVYGIYLSNTSDNLSNFTVSGNYIGGGAAYCGSAAWTQDGVFVNNFRGIQLSAGSSATNNSVQGNTIANFSWSSINNTTLPGSWVGIYVSSGAANIGTVTGNTIGAATGTGSISITHNGSIDGQVLSSGIVDASGGGTVNISNNIVGSVTTTALAIGWKGAGFYGVWVNSSGTHTVSANTIGSTVTANSINAGFSNTQTAQQFIAGIFFGTSATGTNNITNNTIANLNNSGTGTSTSAYAQGIAVNTGTCTITGNTIRNLSNTVQNTNTSSTAGVVGISMNTATPALVQTCSGNTIYDLSNNTTAAVNVVVIGILLRSATGTNSVADGNIIHSLNSTATGTAAIYGIYFSGGSFRLSNNMVRLGIDAAGNSISAGHIIRGINEASGIHNIYHNSIYIGGTGVSGSSATAAFYSPLNQVRSIINNIFVNNRSNGSGSGSHYSISLGTTIINLTMSNNLYEFTGSGGQLGLYNATSYNTLAGWQTATGKDASSVNADPLFVNTTGTSTEVNLHLAGNTPAEAAGANVAATVLYDFDGTLRSGLSPHDIGADANDFGNTWTGAVDNDWNTAGNWADNSVPSSTESLILSDVTNDPDISGSTITINNITLNRGASLIIGSSGELVATGKIDNSGTINATGGTITLNGSAAQSIIAGTITATDFELGNSSGATITSGTLNVLGTYTPTSGTLATGGFLVLKSTASGTGRIAAGGSGGGYISGTLTAERYSTGKRTYRLYAHPFSSAIALSQLVNEIDITGNGGAANGFTPTNTNAPSAYWFDATAADTSTSTVNSGWTAFNSANTASWNQYQLMLLYLRGAKGEGLTGGAYTPSASTFDAAGVVNQGTQVVSLTKGTNSNFAAVGNPFPSGVQMNTVTLGGNVGANYYAWDATSGATGAYVTNAYTLSYILSAYAGFFTTISATTNITFQESDKANGGAGLFKTTTPANWVELLISDSATKWDRLLINLDDNAMDVEDKLDAKKLFNPGLDFYTLAKDNAHLAIDVRPYADSTSIPLGLTAYNRFNKYVLKTGMFDIPAGTKLILNDKYLNKTEELKVGTEYWFDVTADTLSQGEQRFEINMVGKPTSIIVNGNNMAKMQLIPNPAQNEVKLSFDKIQGTAQIRLMSVTGQVVYHQAVNAGSGSVIIPLQNLPAGIYIAELQSSNARFTEKLIKE